MYWKKQLTTGNSKVSITRYLGVIIAGYEAYVLQVKVTRK